MQLTDKIKNSKVFCTSPWVHLHSHPNGEVVTCCLSPSDVVVGNLHNQDIIEIWNADKIKELRTNILAGVPTPEICHRCYNKENEGFQSLRTGLNSTYLQNDSVIDVIESTLKDGTVEKLNLIHWDFRFSNLCNMSCRSCGPGLSSSWVSDNRALFNIVDDSPSIIKLPKDRNDKFLNDVLSNIDSVQSIHFAGGEPMMMEEHWIILDALKDAGRHDVSIHYSTNFTTLKFKNKHAFDYWGLFKHVNIAASIDDIGPRFEYIRNGGKWKTVEENCHAFKNQKFENVRLSFHPTISIFNALYLPELIKYIFENDNFNPFFNRGEKEPNYYARIVNLNPLTYPDIYSIQVLPSDIKKQIEIKLVELIKYSVDNITFDVEPLVSLIRFMYAADRSELLPNFVNYTHRIDQLRNQDLFKTFPEFLSFYHYLSN